MLPEGNYFRFDVNITPREEDKQWLKSIGKEDKLEILGKMDHPDPVNLQVQKNHHIVLLNVFYFKVFVVILLFFFFSSHRHYIDQQLSNKF
jgi:hypothetical protein